jgi:hypothetical protein
LRSLAQFMMLRLGHVSLQNQSFHLQDHLQHRILLSSYCGIFLIFFIIHGRFVLFTIAIARATMTLVTTTTYAVCALCVIFDVFVVALTVTVVCWYCFLF